MQSNAMWIRPPNSGVFRLLNPFESIHHHQPAHIEKVEKSAKWSEGEQSLIFIHGMSYNNTQMALDDFVNPFERSAKIYKNSQDNLRFPLYFVHWDSFEFSQKIEKKINHSRMFSSLIHSYYKGLGIVYLRKFLQTMEERLVEASEELFPFFKDVFSCKSSKKPWMLTHSYGSMLWSEIARKILLNAYNSKKFGCWWSMQAAVDYDAFSKGKRYEDVARIYTPSEGGIVHDWFSRNDFVLKVLYKLGKRNVAAGEIGMLSHGLRCSRDVSVLSQEAHGNTTFFNRDSFFQRVQEPIFHDTNLILKR